MDAWPELDIYFPKDRESSLVEEMKKRATGLWEWRADGPTNRPVEDGHYYFHRAMEGSAPPCTVCLHRKDAGQLFISGISPDAFGQIPHDQIIHITNDFASTIAEPAALAVDGYSSVGTSTHKLEDYFSKDAIEFLQDFCLSSNAGDGGSHANDQQKWMAFLIYQYRNKKQDVNCDVFGRLLRAKEWWPDEGIPKLVSEYDFAMRLLRQAENS